MKKNLYRCDRCNKIMERNAKQKIIETFCNATDSKAKLIKLEKKEYNKIQYNYHHLTSTPHMVRLIILNFSLMLKHLELRLEERLQNQLLK